MRQSIIEIMADVLKIPKEKITYKMEFSIYSKWDSLSHISLIAKLEDSFDLFFEPEEIAEMINLKKIISVIENKSKNNKI